MLTRLKINKKFRCLVRCMSKKYSDTNDKTPTDATPQNSDKQGFDSNKNKIQELLKSMLAKPKINENEYRKTFATAPDIRRRKQKPDEIEVKVEKIEENITKAAIEVAETIGGDVKKTETELLSKVLGKINQTSTSLSDLLVGMKVDRTKDSDDFTRRDTRGDQVKRMVDRSKTQFVKPKYSQKREQTRPSDSRSSMMPATVINVFSGQPLGIFKTKEPNYGTQLDVWDSLKERELAMATAQPPANYFEKMILWTDQGKVWKFPINNEQGMEEEEKVHFSEHVFLDTYLDGWCPKKGPIRHFMELVCVGLSKNAFYTAQEKKDHIMWYKEYFEDKKDLLNEVGAWDVDHKPSESNAVH